MTSTQSASDGASTPLAYSNGQGSSEYYAQLQSLSQPNPAAAAVPTMRYSTLTGVSGALQTKNMSSGFMKEAKNVYWNRRKNDTRQYIREQKAAKRRRFVDGTGGGEAADEDGQEDDRATSAAPARSNTGRGNDENGDESSGGEDGTSVGAGSARGRTSQTPDVKGKGRDYTHGAGLLPDPSKVLIIHPGSRTLRFGRATDATPFEVPHVIARKRLNTASAPPAQSRSPRRELTETQLDILKHDLKARMRILKLRGTSGGSLAAKEYNESVVPVPVEADADDFPIAWINPAAPEHAEKTVFFGEDAIHIDSPLNDTSGGEDWVVRWPFTKSGFNTTNYSSSRELLGDVQDMWLDAFRSKCGIAAKDLESFSAVLVIPDLFDEVYIREMCELLLGSMGFVQIILEQEALCATFAAGLPSACVVDLGASRISISCIDDGLIVPDSRMILDYGGDDVTELFLQLLQTVSFPYKDCQLARDWDWELVQWLMEQCCAFNEHNFGVNLFEFSARGPRQKTTKYTMKLHDEVTLPTMCIWSPRVLDWERKLAPKPVLWASAHDIEDPLEMGGHAVTAAMKHSTQHLQPAAQLGAGLLAVPSAGAADASIPGETSSMQVDDPISAGALLPDNGLRASSPAVSASGKPAGTKSGTPAPSDAPPAPAQNTLDYLTESSKLPLDVAVFESLCMSGTDDKVKRVATNILVVGGVGNAQGIGFALQSRLEPLMKQRFPGGPNPLVIPRSKYADPAHLAWKGIQNLCRLDVVSDLWIRKDDWEMLNLRALRDRSFFSLP